MKKIMTVSHYAYRTLEAYKHASVQTVYPSAIQKIETMINSHKKGYYVGVKNADVIPHLFLSRLENSGFIIHTVDTAAKGGRAIDQTLINPITLRYMTGSSSGTALNVFHGINDIGIGTDGGGSVLAPALSLNLYALISTLFEQEAMRKFSKKSTDNIEFSPSLGYMAKGLETIEELLDKIHDIKMANEYEIINGLSTMAIHQPLHELFASFQLNVSQNLSLNYDNLGRSEMIRTLKNIDLKDKVLVLSEGPVDVLGYGDSVQGHLGNLNASLQQLGHKYYLKVINMAGLSALVIPTCNHGMGYLLVSESSVQGLAQLIDLGKQMVSYQSTLIESYFDFVKEYLKEGIQ